MPRLDSTQLDAFRQLADLEERDDPKHFAEALGARPKSGGAIGENPAKRRTLNLFDR